VVGGREQSDIGDETDQQCEAGEKFASGSDGLRMGKEDEIGTTAHEENVSDDFREHPLSSIQAL
jgi:hypothetical protein